MWTTHERTKKYVNYFQIPSQLTTPVLVLVNLDIFYNTIFIIYTHYTIIGSLPGVSADVEQHIHTRRTYKCALHTHWHLPFDF